MIGLCGGLLVVYFLCFMFQKCLVRLGVALLPVEAVSVTSTCSHTQTFPLHGARILSSALVVIDSSLYL